MPQAGALHLPLVAACAILEHGMVAVCAATGVGSFMHAKKKSTRRFMMVPDDEPTDGIRIIKR